MKLGTRQDDGVHLEWLPTTLDSVSGTATWSAPQAPAATQPAGVPVLKDIPIINRLYTMPTTSGELKTRPITFNDGDLLASVDVAGNLLAIDVKTGSIVFHGPLTTEEQWKNAPQIVREKLSAWKALIAPSGHGSDPGQSGGK